MIFREDENNFIMITQHDHARLSGDIASNFLQRYFVDNQYFNAVILSIYEHDRSWIRLDDTPIWNDEKSAPFSFMDYPLLPKLILYRYGLDEVEAMNKYSALLCSLHYSSFSHLVTSNQIDCVDFISHEWSRQKRIKENLGHYDHQMIFRHFKLLQLCDSISLYLCLNHPGVSKEDEHPWYKNGFETVIEEITFVAKWLSNSEVTINPFPFKSDFSTSFKTKHVSKEKIKQFGLNAAYTLTDWKEQQVVFINNG